MPCCRSVEFKSFFKSSIHHAHKPTHTGPPPFPPPSLSSILFSSWSLLSVSFSFLPSIYVSFFPSLLMSFLSFHQLENSAFALSLFNCSLARSSLACMFYFFSFFCLCVCLSVSAFLIPPQPNKTNIQV